jgi:segregation and condensation protein B
MSAVPTEPDDNEFDDEGARTNEDEKLNDQQGEFGDSEEDGFDDEPEFSLNQLSEAYAEVIEAQTGVRPKVVVPGEEQSEQDSSGEPIAAETDDDAACPISPESIIEAILFVGAPRDVKLTSRKIASILRDVSPKEVTQIVRRLNRKYEHENAAYRVKSDGGVFEMVLDSKLNDFQQEFFGRNRQVKLSQAAVEVMALVAYNQPITREQVDALRNKPSGGVLKQLLKRQLLAQKPDEDNAKIVYYWTAERFLDLFQLDSIADLPQTHDVADIAELAD